MDDLESPVLSLDCSTSIGSAAIGVGGRIVAEISVAVSGGHSSALLPAIDQIMRAAGVMPNELGRILVGSGPGSFTGLRIAAGTAKGMAHALEIPMVAFSSLLAAAAPFGGQRERVGVLFDARGRDVFVGCFGFSSTVEVLLTPVALTLDEAVEALRRCGVTRLVGDGATRHADELESRLGVSIVPAPFEVPRAGALVWLASRYPESGAVTSPSSWEPDYLRPSGAERIAAAKAASAGGGA